MAEKRATLHNANVVWSKKQIEGEKYRASGLNSYAGAHYNASGGTSYSTPATYYNCPNPIL